MDKNAIKKYAVWARNELIERVSQKADQYEISADADPTADSAHGVLLTADEKKQRAGSDRAGKRKRTGSGDGGGCLHLVQPLLCPALYGGQ